MSARAKRKGAATILIASVLALILLGGCASLQDKRAEPSERAAKTPESPSLSNAPSRQLPLLGENSTVDDYATYALLKNPGLRSAYNRWMAALEKVPQVKSLPDPALSYSRSVSGMESSEVELMQMIPFFGKLGLRGEAALAAARAAHARYEDERLNLISRVKEAYYEYYYTGRAVRVTEETIELLKRLEEVASIRFRAGGTQQDVLKAQVELEKLGNDLKTLQNMQGAVAARLNAELSRPIDTPIPWPSRIEQQKLNFSDEQVLQLAESGNRDLKAMAFEVEENQNMLAHAKREFWPDFGLGIGYMTGEVGAMGEMTTDEEDAWQVMVSVNLPIWRKRLYAAVREGQASLRAALEAKEQAKNSLLSKVRFSLYKYNDALRQVALYKNTLIPKAEQALSASQAGYRAGEVDFVNLIDSERELLSFRLEYEMALAEHQKRIAELEMLSGQPLTDLATGDQKEESADAAGEPAS